MYKKPTLTIFVLLLLGVGIVPTRASLQDGLVSYWKLDEVSGTAAADSSGKGLTGTLKGDAMWAPTSGQTAGAMFVPGVDIAGGLEIPTTGMSVSAGTVALLGYLSATQPVQTRYFFGHTAQPQFSSRIQLYMDTGTLLAVGLGDAHAKATGIVQLDLEMWYHIALTWNNGSYVVYVDGKEVNRGSYTGLTALNTIANIGNDGSSAPYEPFGGLLDEVRIYNRALTADEVKSLAPLKVKAWAPSPANGARDVMSPLFSWKLPDIDKYSNVYVGTDPNLTAANLVAPLWQVALYFYIPGLQPGVTYYWRIDGVEADKVTVHTGDVWSFLAQPTTAYDPVPADGTNTASPAAVLKWSKGIGVGKHHLYFGDNLDAVKQGAASVDKGELTDLTFTPSGLQEATAYYWRVDEIGAGNAVVTGKVWSFATIVPVEGFESYTDIAGSRIYEAWIDGLTNNTGSTVGYLTAPFAEQKIVHGGLQSMPLDFNNVNSPFYSEAELTFAAKQNWTASGTDTLVLFVQGKITNGAAPIYVALKDASNHTAVVTHPDQTVVTVAKWTEWKIPLSSFTGVNASAVKAIDIGVGNRAKPAKGGAGLIFIDDIGLAIPAPAAK